MFNITVLDLLPHYDALFLRAAQESCKVALLLLPWCSETTCVAKDLCLFSGRKAVIDRRVRVGEIRENKDAKRKCL